MFETQEFLRVKNNEDTPFVFHYNSRRYQVAANGEAFVPFEAVATRLGDPRSQSHGVFFKPDAGGPSIGIPPRLEEVARLQLKWGHLAADHALDPRTLLERMPNVEVFTLDNQRVVLPAEDPDCIQETMPLDVTIQSNDVNVRMAQLERELATLRLMAEDSKAAAANATEQASPDEIPEDGGDGQVIPIVNKGKTSLPPPG